MKNNLAKGYLNANMLGINLASGVTFKPITGATIGIGTTLAESPINGYKNLAKDLAFNVAGEGLG